MPEKHDPKKREKKEKKKKEGKPCLKKKERQGLFEREKPMP